MYGSGPARAEATSAEPRTDLQLHGAEATSAEPRADLPRVPIGQLSMYFLADPSLPRNGASGQSSAKTH